MTGEMAAAADRVGTKTSNMVNTAAANVIGTAAT